MKQLDLAYGGPKLASLPPPSTEARRARLKAQADDMFARADAARKRASDALKAAHGGRCYLGAEAFEGFARVLADGDEFLRSRGLK